VLFRSKIGISYSLISKFLYKGNEIDFCPAFVYGAYIKRFAEDKMTPSMMNGVFFETAVIGSGKYNKVHDLPRKKVTQKMINEAIKKGNTTPLGEKTIDQIRIELQIERAKVVFYNNGVNIIPGVNTQTPVFAPYNDRFFISMTSDIFPTTRIYNGAEVPAIIDLKLTSKLSTTFGQFSWGDFPSMDHTQGHLALHILKDFDFKYNPHLKQLCKNAEIWKNSYFWFSVFEYQQKNVEDLKNEWFGVTYNPEIKETIRKTIAIYEKCEEEEWPANPVYDICKTCPFNYNTGGKCVHAINEITC
jgi:hypothetical protein